MRFSNVIAFFGLLACGCGDSAVHSSGGPSATADASAETAAPNPCRPGACGVFKTASGETVDCGGCSAGETCGDNGQPNICGSLCTPKANPIACDNLIEFYGLNLPTGVLLEYSYYCRTDPPIDQYNCVPWQKYVINDTNGTGPCVDCDPVYCCLPPSYGAGQDGGTDAADAD